MPQMQEMTRMLLDLLYRSCQRHEHVVTVSAQALCCAVPNEDLAVIRH